MGDQVQATLPPDVLNVYQLAELVLFAAGGIAIALLGALGPAGWAGRIRTATALRTE
jgi:putative ABC transport system permease protein